jgi:glycosyltransferase involved in cell wall biosynthesis
MSRRLLLATFAAPSPAEPRLGSWNVDQALGLRQHGWETTIWRPRLKVPLVHGLLRRPAPPANYEVREIAIESPPVPFHYLPWLRFRLFPNRPRLASRVVEAAVARRLDRRLRQDRPDALFVLGGRPWAAIAAKLAKRHGLPWAVMEQSAPDVDDLRRDTPFGDWYTHHVASAVGVFCCGQQMAEHLREQLDVEATWLPNGVDLAPLRLDQDRPEGWGDDFVIMAAAGPYRRKGLHELVEAFGRVHERLPPSRLVLVTPATPELRELVAASSARARIDLVPPMENEALQAWMGHADLFAMPSWQEGFGIVYVEAMGRATPVLMTSDCGLAADVVPFDAATPTTSHGWVVRPRDVDAVAEALVEAAAHRDALPSVGEAGRRLVEERFTWTETTRPLAERLEAACVSR